MKEFWQGFEKRANAFAAVPAGFAGAMGGMLLINKDDTKRDKARKVLGGALAGEAALLAHAITNHSHAEDIIRKIRRF